MSIERLLGATCAAMVISISASASAGGYDAPVLYSARHMGMGGAALSYVNDASALFHNPAGIGRVGRGNLLLDVCLVMGHTSSPVASVPGSNESIVVQSELVFAPFFIVGGVGRILDWLTAGIAVYPVASSGGTFIYDDRRGHQVEDAASLFFLEIAPGVAVNLPGRVTLGLTWRATLVNMVRTTSFVDGNTSLDLEFLGWSFAGFRAGIQQEIIEDHLTMGITYRHRTETNVRADSGVALDLQVTDVRSFFILPSRLGVGIRGDFFRFALAVDLEYSFQTQNAVTTISAKFPGATQAAEFENNFDWQDGLTLRCGIEYNVDLERGRSLPIRVGYVFETPVTVPEYPSAFAGPPGNVHTFTAGVGYDSGTFQFNLAYAYAMGHGEVRSEQIASTCHFCSYAGDYDVATHGLNLDFSYDWY